MGRVTTLHMPQFQDKEHTKMAGIRKSTLPVLRVGKTATEPTVSVSEGGQLRFNKLAAEAFGDSKKLVLWQFEPEKRTLTVVGFTGTFPKVAKGEDPWTEVDLFELPKGESNKGKYISCASAFQQLEYDYHASGNQSMKDVKVNAEKRIVAFTLPKGALTPVAKITRPRKAKGAPAATQTATAGAAGDDMDLTI